MISSPTTREAAYINPCALKLVPLPLVPLPNRVMQSRANCIDTRDMMLRSRPELPGRPLGGSYRRATLRVHPTSYTHDTP